MWLLTVRFAVSTWFPCCSFTYSAGPLSLFFSLLKNDYKSERCILDVYNPSLYVYYHNMSHTGETIVAVENNRVIYTFTIHFNGKSTKEINCSIFCPVYRKSISTQLIWYVKTLLVTDVASVALQIAIIHSTTYITTIASYNNTLLLVAQKFGHPKIFKK